MVNEYATRSTSRMRSRTINCRREMNGEAETVAEVEDAGDGEDDTGREHGSIHRDATGRRHRGEKCDYIKGEYGYR
jgi:hypothetical protein